MTRRIHSFVWGGLAFATMLIIGIVSSSILPCLAIGVLAFTLVSCLILANNFVGEMIMEIFSWGFVTMPGLIFSITPFPVRTRREPSGSSSSTLRSKQGKSPLLAEITLMLQPRVNTLNTEMKSATTFSHFSILISRDLTSFLILT